MVLFVLTGLGHATQSVPLYTANVSVIEAAPPVLTHEEQVAIYGPKYVPLDHAAGEFLAPTVTPSPTQTPEPVLIVSALAPPIVKTVVPIPTIKPIPTASVVTTQQLSGDALSAAVNTYFPEQPQKAYRVFMCESGGNPAAVSPNGKYVGVAQQDIQIHGYPPPDVMGQVAKARQIYLSAGSSWWPWPVCQYQ